MPSTGAAREPPLVNTWRAASRTAVPVVSPRPGRGVLGEAAEAGRLPVAAMPPYRRANSDTAVSVPSRNNRGHMASLDQISLRGRAAVVGAADAVSPTGELDISGKA